MSNPPYAAELQLCRCPHCADVCNAAAGACLRCGAALQRRKAHSLSRTWALLIAAVVFYAPANLLPVMHTALFGNASDNTLISGVLEFWRSGSWDIALLIFLASIAVPCLKFFGLALLLITCQRRSSWAMRERARLYRLLEAIGYWSMLDVLVVALIAALVQFRALSSIEPRIGILFFGLVVVLTMLATMAFDPRLIWDADHDRD
jgi:paraquat-inducible protein A